MRIQLDVKPIKYNVDYVVGYLFKSIKHRKVDFDDVIIYPKATGILREQIICL